MNQLSSQIAILILISLVISTIILQQILLTRKEGVEKPVSIPITITNYKADCRYNSGRFALTLNYCKDYQLGSELQVIGTLAPQSASGFFGQKKLVIQHLNQIPTNQASAKHWFIKVQLMVSRFKHSLLEKLAIHLPEPAAGLVGGMVFGGTATLPREFQNALRTTGLTHVAAASGYNVSLVVTLWLQMWQHLVSRRLLGALGIVVAVLYTVAAEGTPAVVRASLMASLGLAGRYFWYRPSHPGWRLLLTVLIILALQPLYVMNLSFLLSVSATAGIMLVMPLWGGVAGWWQRLALAEVAPFSLEENRVIQASTSSSNWLWSKIQTLVWQPAVEAWQTTVAAQALSVPLMLGVFGEFSLVSFISNPLLLWVTPLLTVGGLIWMLVAGVVALWPFSLVSFLWDPLLSLSAGILFLLAEIFIKGVEWLGQWQSGVIKWQWSLVESLGWYLGVLGGLAGWRWRQRQKLKAVGSPP